MSVPFWRLSFKWKLFYQGRAPGVKFIGNINSERFPSADTNAAIAILIGKGNPFLFNMQHHYFIIAHLSS